MKTSFFSTVVIFLLFLASCNNEKIEQSEPTSAGLTLNTISATIKGEKYIFKSPLSERIHLATITVDPYTKNNQMVMDASVDIIDGKNFVRYLRFQIQPSNGRPTSYPIIFPDFANPDNMRSFINYSEGVHGKTQQWRMVSGTFEIVSYDEATRVAEGKFNGLFKALIDGVGTIDEAKEPLEIKDGLFKVQMYKP